MEKRLSTGPRSPLSQLHDRSNLFPTDECTDPAGKGSPLGKRLTGPAARFAELCSPHTDLCNAERLEVLTKLLDSTPSLASTLSAPLADVLTQHLSLHLARSDELLADTATPLKESLCALLTRAFVHCDGAAVITEDDKVFDAGLALLATQPLEPLVVSFKTILFHAHPNVAEPALAFILKHCVKVEEPQTPGSGNLTAVAPTELALTSDRACAAECIELAFCAWSDEQLMRQKQAIATALGVLEASVALAVPPEMDKEGIVEKEQNARRVLCNSLERARKSVTSRKGHGGTMWAEMAQAALSPVLHAMDEMPTHCQSHAIGSPVLFNASPVLLGSSSELVHTGGPSISGQQNPVSKALLSGGRCARPSPLSAAAHSVTESIVRQIAQQTPLPPPLEPTKTPLPLSATRSFTAFLLDSTPPLDKTPALKATPAPLCLDPDALSHTGLTPLISSMILSPGRGLRSMLSPLGRHIQCRPSHNCFLGSSPLSAEAEEISAGEAVPEIPARSAEVLAPVVPDVDYSASFRAYSPPNKTPAVEPEDLAAAPPAAISGGAVDDRNAWACEMPTVATTLIDAVHRVGHISPRLSPRHRIALPLFSALLCWATVMWWRSPAVGPIAYFKSPQGAHLSSAWYAETPAVDDQADDSPAQPSQDAPFLTAAIVSGPPPVMWLPAQLPPLLAAPLVSVASSTAQTERGVGGGPLRGSEALTTHVSAPSKGPATQRPQQGRCLAKCGLRLSPLSTNASKGFSSAGASYPAFFTLAIDSVSERADAPPLEHQTMAVNMPARLITWVSRRTPEPVMISPPAAVRFKPLTAVQEVYKLPPPPVWHPKPFPQLLAAPPPRVVETLQENSPRVVETQQQEAAVPAEMAMERRPQVAVSPSARVIETDAIEAAAEVEHSEVTVPPREPIPEAEPLAMPIAPPASLSDAIQDAVQSMDEKARKAVATAAPVGAAAYARSLGVLQQVALLTEQAARLDASFEVAAAVVAIDAVFVTIDRAPAALGNILEAIDVTARRTLAPISARTASLCETTRRLAAFTAGTAARVQINLQMNLFPVGALSAWIDWTTSGILSKMAPTAVSITDAQEALPPPAQRMELGIVAATLVCILILAIMSVRASAQGGGGSGDGETWLSPGWPTRPCTPPTTSAVSRAIDGSSDTADDLRVLARTPERGTPCDAVNTEAEKTPTERVTPRALIRQLASPPQIKESAPPSSVPEPLPFLSTPGSSLTPRRSARLSMSGIATPKPVRATPGAPTPFGAHLGAATLPQIRPILTSASAAALQATQGGVVTPRRSPRRSERIARD